MSDQSYDNIPSAASVSSDELDSLPSTSASTTSISPSEEEWQSDAEREWKESLQQLELLLTMVLVPYLGKYFGRKAAYWGWTKYMEWKYPVHIEITNPGVFKGIGAVEAAASLDPCSVEFTTRLLTSLYLGSDISVTPVETQREQAKEHPLLPTSELQGRPTLLVEAAAHRNPPVISGRSGDDKVSRRKSHIQP